MGVIQHNVVIVTTFDEKLIEQSYNLAKQMFHQVTEIVKSPINGFYTFFVPTIGSKVGWEPYENYCDKREEFYAKLKYIDNWDCLQIIEVSYGEFGTMSTNIIEDEGDEKECPNI